MKVYSYYKDGSFDRRDKNRLKPISRLYSKIEDAKEDGMSKRVNDWYMDIDNGYSK